MGLDEVLRDAEIGALDLVDGTPPQILDHLVRAAALMTGATAARINVITSEAQHAIADSTGAVGRDDLEASLCARALRRPERVQLVPDARVDPLFSDSVFVTSGAVTTYAAAQLVTAHGVSIGTLCIFDPQPREITQAMLDALGQLGEAAVQAMEVRRERADMGQLLQVLAGGSKELRRSNEHLAAFAGQVSHDVKGPLAAVQMALELIQEDLDGEEHDRAQLAAFVGTALSSARRMHGTVSGLMDFAVLGGRLQAEQVDAVAVVEEVLVDLAARRGATEVVVEPLPKLYGDRVQVRAVLQNLVANAFKHATTSDGPVVTLSGSTHDGRTTIRVADNGPGVPLAQREAVFELLVRGDAAADAGVDGAGIGLATCRRIVEAHGDSIGVGESPRAAPSSGSPCPTPDA